MNPKQTCAMLVFLLSACGGNPADLSKATPATESALANYSRNISRSVEIGKNADLVQRFCKNTTSQPCPEDIAERLKAFDYVDGGTGVDMANAFAMMAADQKDGKPDKQSTDEDFLAAAYRVALAREPDASGATVNLNFIKEGGDRKQMLRSLLESQEFKSLPQ